MVNRPRDTRPLFNQEVIDEELGSRLEGYHIRGALASLCVGYRHEGETGEEADDEATQESRDLQHLAFARRK
jgi:hypothetical protein